jgi:tricarballylate dehydrogenase
VVFHYGTTAVGLEQNKDGRVTGLIVEKEQTTETISATAVIVASGGFEGNPDFLDEQLGRKDRPLIPIAPGALFNQGEGIRMALDAGAQKSGEWAGFHAEPVDPRATHAEAIVMAFPYGILVDNTATRFIDEGRGTIDETYEDTARAIWARPDGIAYFVTDQHFYEEVARGREGILSEVEPFVSDTIEGLAGEIGLPSSALSETVRDFNATTTDAPFKWEQPDGKSTVGLNPAKSNWAFPLDRGPYIAYPISCAIVFTYGGLATDENGRVLGNGDAPIEGLYAVGECTGLYHGKYPGGTSVLRGMIFGRLAGSHSVSQAASLQLS